MDHSSMVEAIQQLFGSDWDGEIELRSLTRHPFIRPVTIILADGAEHDAFARNISRDGLGLVHHQPIAMGLVQIDIRLGTATRIPVAAEIVWCGQYQNHYLSGARLMTDATP